jgi:regulation of enolase protein 1 (concanavalin A-like superfamily)
LKGLIMSRFLLRCGLSAGLFVIFGGGLCSLEAAGDTPPNHLFTDSFDRSHNYLDLSVADTGWDGFLGQGEQETVDGIEASQGCLRLQSTNGRYDAGRPLGPLLYKTVMADFKATVQVKDYQMISFNNGGIMARVANRADAGEGEDWISVDYFPLYGGIYARMSDDNHRTENANSGQGRNADKYLQLERVGNLFFLRHSSDGLNWHELPCSPITRSDLVNVPLQVGLFHATYSDNQAQIMFDDFTLEWGEQIKTARLHSRSLRNPRVLCQDCLVKQAWSTFLPSPTLKNGYLTFGAID